MSPWVTCDFCWVLSNVFWQCGADRAMQTGVWVCGGEASVSHAQWDLKEQGILCRKGLTAPHVPRLCHCFFTLCRHHITALHWCVSAPRRGIYAAHKSYHSWCFIQFEWLIMIRESNPSEMFKYYSLYCRMKCMKPSRWFVLGSSGSVMK